MNYGTSMAALPRTCEQRWASWHEFQAPIHAAGKPPGRAKSLNMRDPHMQYQSAVRYRTALLRDCPSGPSLDRPVSLTVPGPLLPLEDGIRFSRKELLEQVPWWGWVIVGVVLVRAMR